MIRMSPGQMDVFEQAALLRFEDEMVAHSKEFTPRLSEILGDAQLRVVIQLAIERSKSYGFTNRGPIRLYLELMFMCGSHFDTDPQYTPIAKILSARGDQMQRAEVMCQRFGDYLQQVSGPDNSNVRKALEALSVFAQKPLTFSANTIAASLHQEMTRAFPEKVAYTGSAALSTLIDKGLTNARKYGFHTVRGQSLIVVLLFAFGHGCTDDPLYPWISRTLTDERIVDSPGRAERLERKAVTWLDHVLARSSEGASP